MFTFCLGNFCVLCGDADVDGTFFEEVGCFFLGKLWKMLGCFFVIHLHPPKQTWNLKMGPWKRRFLLETIISRFQPLTFGGVCIHCENFTTIFDPSRLRTLMVGLSAPQSNWDHCDLTDAQLSRSELNGCSMAQATLRCGSVDQLMINCWFGARWFGILGVPPSNSPFHEGILGIQTTNPNHQLTIN